MLVALALDAAPDEEAARLDGALGRALSAAQVDDLRGIIARSGAQQQVEDVIAALTERALTVLDDAALRPEADAVLRELAAAATQRSV